MNSPVLSAAGWDAEVAKMIDAFGAPIDLADAKTIAGYLKRNYAYALLDQIEVRLAEDESPFLEKDKSVSDPLSSDSEVAHHPGRNHGYGLLDQIEARLAGIESPSREKDQRVSGRPSPISETAHYPGRNHGYELFDQIEARLAGIESPSREKNQRVSERPLSNSEIAHERYDTRTEPPRRVTIPWASNHASFERASLQSKSTSACAESQSCLGYVPLLLGVGF
jgi:hypothetical protein